MIEVYLFQISIILLDYLFHPTFDYLVFILLIFLILIIKYFTLILLFFFVIVQLMSNHFKIIQLVF
jgi:hypothetical protein